MQLAGRGYGATIPANNRSPTELAAQIWQTTENRIEMKPTPARYSCHADLIVRDRRNVSLAQVAPVDLNLIAPWGHTVMPPEAKASAPQRTPLQSRPAANPGCLPVGAHQIAIGDRPCLQPTRWRVFSSPRSTRQPHFMRTPIEAACSVNCWCNSMRRTPSPAPAEICAVARSSWPVSSIGKMNSRKIDGHH